MFWTLDIWKGFKKLSYTVGKRLKKKSMPDTYVAATENERPTLVSYDWYWIRYKEANTGILNKFNRMGLLLLFSKFLF